MLGRKVDYREPYKGDVKSCEEPDFIELAKDMKFPGQRKRVLLLTIVVIVVTEYQLPPPTPAPHWFPKCQFPLDDDTIVCLFLFPQGKDQRRKKLGRLVRKSHYRQ